MSRPQFSIVVPTRDREGTLHSTLQTCLQQDFDDYEIVLSDNSTTHATRELIESMATSRIRYVRPPEPMAMSEHWDYAISQAQGEFITVLGDDDGMLEHGLRELNRIIVKFGAQCLRWEPVCYNWPDMPQQEFAKANELLIPLKQVDYYHPIYLRESGPMIQAAANSQISYSQLPMIYCSVIHRSLIEDLRKRQAGRLFLSQCPDVYSSFAFAYLTGNYHAVDAPMSINALSGRSNGVGNLYLKNQSSVAQDFHTLNSRARLLLHPSVPNLPVMAAFVADSFQHVKQALFPQDDSFHLNRKQLVGHCMRELSVANEEEWQAALNAVHNSLGDKPDLSASFTKEYGARTLSSFLAGKRRQRHKRYGGTHLHLDASDFGVTNVFEAAQLCEHLLGYKRDGVSWRENTEGSDHQSMSQLVEKEEAIQSLSTACNEKEEMIQSLIKSRNQKDEVIQLLIQERNQERNQKDAEIGELWIKIGQHREKKEELRAKIEALRAKIEQLRSKN